jgi:carboxyvinyl-carboxyphosphonate phosphorylmutase
MEDAIARLVAYQETGVDALMIPALSSREELDRIAAATTLPLVVGGMPAAMCDPAYLASRRARLWSGGHQTVNVGIQALHDAMKAVHHGTLASTLPGVADKTLLRTVTAADDYGRATRQFLGH